MRHDFAPGRVRASRWLASALIVCAAVGGCDGEMLGVDYSGGQFDQKIQVGDRLREYLVYVPPDLSPGQAVPLLLVFHGSSGTAESMMLITWFNEQAVRAGFVVAYMQSDGDRWASVGSPPIGPPTSGELAYVDAVINQVAADIQIDRSRVYASGFSNGGLMMQRLGCQFYDRIAAIGVVSATIAFPVVQGCSPQRNLPAMFFLGDLDNQFPWSNSLAANLGLLGAEETGQFWADLNNCGTRRVDSDLPDIVDDNTSVERWDWPDCPTDGRVVFYHIRKGGHTWPGSPLNLSESLGPKTHDIDASRLIADFLLEQRIGSIP